MTSDVTMVVTSCRRFDLLEKTLTSFFKWNDYPLKEIIIIEDSDDTGIFQFKDLFPDQPIRVIFNEINIGQTRSVDKAYAEVTTPFIFHIEDDWEFTDFGVIRDLKTALETEPNALLALARTETDIPKYVGSVRTTKKNGISYKRLYPELHFRWYTFTYNPTLKRTADYRQLPEGYAGVGNELALSRFYKAQNKDLCWVLGHDVRHIGGHGRTNYPKQKAKSSSAAISKNKEKWSQSAKRRFWHALRTLGINTERLQRRSSPDRYN